MERRHAIRGRKCSSSSLGASFLAPPKRSLRHSWESTHDIAFLRSTGFEFCRDTLALYQCTMHRTLDGGYVNLRDTNGECGYSGYYPGGCKRKDVTESRI